MNNFSLKIADDWIWIRILLCQMRQLCQQWHNPVPNWFIFVQTFLAYFPVRKVNKQLSIQHFNSLFSLAMKIRTLDFAASGPPTTAHGKWANYCTPNDAFAIFFKRMMSTLRPTYDNIVFKLDLSWIFKTFTIINGPFQFSLSFIFTQFYRLKL